jgi:hypothetical protein
MISIVSFISKFVKKTETGKPLALRAHQIEMFNRAFELMGQWNTFVYSTIKKSGKTTVQAIFHLWWAWTHPDDEILIAANDLEQGKGRVFKVMCGIIRHNPALRRECRILADRIIFKNGTVVTVIANDAPGEAGANQGDSGWDELWGFASERSQRLWEELCPVPNKPSVRFVSTYAGWTGESKLLWDLYVQGVGKDECPEGRAERIHPTLPLYLNREAGLLCYWDHEPRMEWQTPDYYARQKRSLRPGTYLRLHENRWSTAQEIFITPELWNPCIDPELSPIIRGHQLFVGVDASTKHDSSAVVAVRWDEAGEKLLLASHRIWQPSPKEPLNLEETIENHLRELHNGSSLQEVLCDPYQLHRSITTLVAAGLPIREFPQSVPNTTLMGQTLFDLLNGKNIRLYPAEDLRQHAFNTVAVESVRGWRIAKEKASKKIDAIVALSMACVAALQGGAPLPFEIWSGGSRTTRVGPEGDNDPIGAFHSNHESVAGHYADMNDVDDAVSRFHGPLYKVHNW